ncbi:MAG: hypothetical protein EA379_12205 [Phycisphaerales bacterium]|nr:MAG: hypothetical protein EA379_12205 [Phycisphaerales bacterium]
MVQTNATPVAAAAMGRAHMCRKRAIPILIVAGACSLGGVWLAAGASATAARPSAPTTTPAVEPRGDSAESEANLLIPRRMRLMIEHSRVALA